DYFSFSAHGCKGEGDTRVDVADSAVQTTAGYAECSRKTTLRSRNPLGTNAHAMLNTRIVGKVIGKIQSDSCQQRNMISHLLPPLVNRYQAHSLSQARFILHIEL